MRVLNFRVTPVGVLKRMARFVGVAVSSQLCRVNLLLEVVAWAYNLRAQQGT